MRLRSFQGISFAVVLALVAASPSRAAIVDLTVNDSSGTINGAIYVNGSIGSGSGTFPSFVRLQNSSSEQGYNTTVNKVFDNTGGDPRNYAINLGDIPLVTALSGVQYRVFALDSNEKNSEGDDLISLDEVRIFMGGVANSDSTSVPTTVGPDATFGTLIYSLDSYDAAGTKTTDNWVALSDAFSSGSGTSDDYLYVLNLLFGGSTTTTAGDGPNVIFYSQFGLVGTLSGGASNPYSINRPTFALPDGNYDTTATYEEWAVGFAPNPPPGIDPLIAPLPEPVSLTVWSLGLALCGGFRLRNRFRKA